ncbi:MAG: HPr family phosphocarrier protein [Proteobacteria bacterium]|uniref:HPr family phosphocarrier protein n=1 Tax=Candidatus Avisuccinivibrio stercorigallinarum TaxID=2840704 RepID=A0A9D9DD89_9GAMM|nr:HPr family phosphocarrier protein [Candidatus Avisuccinivibrio stercorigallinarum]
MQEFTFELSDPRGIHARPAGILSKFLSRFACDITIGAAEDDQVNAKHLLELMQLPLRQGDTLLMQFSGRDEVEAAEQTERFLSEHF